MSHSLQLSRPRVTRAGILRWLMRAVVAVFGIVLAAPLATSQKATEDLPPGSMQAKATTSCLECHEARIILQQRLSKAAWTKEVDKMIKWGAVVDASDRDALIEYLSTTFSPDQPAYEAPRTSIEKVPGKSSGKTGEESEVDWPKSKAPPTQCPARRSGHYGSAANSEPKLMRISIGISMHY